MLLKNNKLKLRRTVGLIYNCNNCKNNITSNEIGICSKCANLYENNLIDLRIKNLEDLPYYIRKKCREYIETNKN